jgi:N-carbamoyl-L-amino-acid hydrolase
MTNKVQSGPKVNGERLWSRLMSMAQIGATPNGGCNRQALTDLDMQGRALLESWAQAAGCRVRSDAIGNMFIRRAGTNDSLPVVMTGSHLDTQPTGGKFDGVYGVLAGFEVFESLNDHDIVTQHPLELCVWCNEEGSRFPLAMMGSAVWAGRVDLAEAHKLKDRAGTTVGSEIERLKFPLREPVVRPKVKASLEAHIEQGPVLEQRAKTIGVVTGVQHMCRHEITIHGQEAHAGPTPMHLRKDPIRVLGEVLPAMYAAAAELGADARFTVGFIETKPGSPNTVPGLLRFTADLRHPDATRYQALKHALFSLTEAAIAKHGVTGEVKLMWEAPGVTFDTSCVSAVRTAAQSLGFDAMDIISGAGHDSCNVSAVVPTAMIFVPCAGGLSHNEAESASAQDLEAGANVLLHSMLRLASA